MFEQRTDSFDWSAISERLLRLQQRLDGHGETHDSERILTERRERYRRCEGDDREHGQEIVIFTRAGTTYGLPIASLSEIRRVERLTVLPGAAAVIQGVINIRGHLVVVHDLASCWGRPSHPQGQELWLLVGYHDADHVALLADEVDGIRRLRADELHPVPLSMRQRQDCYLGIHPEGILVLRFEGMVKDKEFFCA